MILARQDNAYLLENFGKFYFFQEIAPFRNLMNQILQVRQFNLNGILEPLRHF
jgi:hypothetical protein